MLVELYLHCNFNCSWRRALPQTHRGPVVLVAIPDVGHLTEQLVRVRRVPLDPLKELQHEAAWWEVLKVEDLTEVPDQFPRGQEALLDTHADTQVYSLAHSLTYNNCTKCP